MANTPEPTSPSADLDQLIAAFREAADPQQAVGMSAYMKNHFDFLGLAKPKRVVLSRPCLRAAKKWPAEVTLAEMNRLFELEQREFHYLAIDLFLAGYRQFDWSSWLLATQFIDRLPWWDSVDALRKPLGTWVAEHPEQINPAVTRLLSGSMWQRRTAITLQLQWKTATDLEALTRSIEENLTDPEFFIQKAIGWALREYAKTDPQWVLDFAAAHDLSPLARREGLKHLS